MPNSSTTGDPFGANARTIRIVFFVCDSAVAAICTHGMSTGRARHPPGTRSSNRSRRHGPQNSISAITAANGDFPDPFANRRTPWLNSHSPFSSTAYHHSRKISWDLVNRNGLPARGPFGWTSHRSAHPAAANPTVRGARGSIGSHGHGGRVESRLPGAVTSEALAPLVKLGDILGLLALGCCRPGQLDAHPAPVTLGDHQRRHALQPGGERRPLRRHGEHLDPGVV